MSRTLLRRRAKEAVLKELLYMKDADTNELQVDKKLTDEDVNIENVTYDIEDNIKKIIVKI